MKIKNERFLEFVLLLIGITICILIKNATRYIGVGFISLSATYLIIDNIEAYSKFKSLHKRNKRH